MGQEHSPPEARLRLDSSLASRLHEVAAQVERLMSEAHPHPGPLPEGWVEVVVPGQTVLPGLRLLAPGEEVEQSVPVRPGAGVVVEVSGGCRSTACGYLGLVGGELRVLSPVRLEASGLQAQWLVLEEGPWPLTREAVVGALAAAGVVEGVLPQAIARLVVRAQAGRQSRGLVVLARGTPAVPGQPATVEVLVPTQQQAGAERPDGSLDFRQVNFAPSARPGEVVARRRPPVPGRPGVTVLGEVLEPATPADEEVLAGDNVEVRLEDGVQYLVATTGGVVRREGARFSVARFVHVDGPVDFHTGNLDFDGEVCITGSVLQGFTVRATGAVTVAGTIELGAQVHCGGDLTVGLGIVGQRTRVVAGGGVRAQFVQEATVSAGGDIVLGSSAYQARLRAGGRVDLTRGAGGRGGSVVGGQIWAGSAIDLLTAGSQAHVPTRLMAGVDARTARQLDRARELADAAYAQFRRLLGQLGVERVDVQQIRAHVSAATGSQRRLAALRARRLGQVAQAYQRLLQARRELESRMASRARGAEIRVRECVYPGVEIRLGEHQRQVQRAGGPARYHLVGDQLAEE
ncbi:MAG: FapA family protein [Candidatus Latescibacterota bacterium]